MRRARAREKERYLCKWDDEKCVRQRTNRERDTTIASTGKVPTGAEQQHKLEDDDEKI